MVPSEREHVLAEELDRLSASAAAGPPRATLIAAAEQWSAEVWSAAEAAEPLTPDPPRQRSGMALAARPVFICGVHRSGTTLLRDLLDGHPDLCVLPSEGTFLTSVKRDLDRVPAADRCGFLTREWLRRLANPTNREPFWCLGRAAAGANPYVEFARRVQGWWGVLSDALGGRNPLWPHLAIVLAYNDSRTEDPRGDGPRYWVDKTPTYELHLVALQRAFPSARLIQMIRHPRAVVASRRTLEERVFGHFRRPHRVMSEIAASMRIALETGSRGASHLVVRYEDLVSAPDGELQRVADFLHVEQHPCLRHPTVAGRPSRSNSSFDVEPESGNIHADEAARRPASELDERLVAAYVARSSARLGYDVVRMAPLFAGFVRARTWLRAR